MSILPFDPCSRAFPDGKCRLTDDERAFELPKMVDGQKHFLQVYCPSLQGQELDILAEATTHLMLACFREWQDKRHESWWTKLRRILWR